MTTSRGLFSFMFEAFGLKEMTKNSKAGRKFLRLAAVLKEIDSISSALREIRADLEKSRSLPNCPVQSDYSIFTRIHQSEYKKDRHRSEASQPVDTDKHNYNNGQAYLQEAR